MNETKGQTIFLSVIGIATLLVAIIGATFAFFTTQMNGNSANLSVKAAKIGSVSFTAEGITLSENNAILPGWSSGDKAVTVTYGASDYPVTYTCTLNVTANTFSDMYLFVKDTNATTANNNKKLNAGASSIQIAGGTINASASSQSNTMHYSLLFKETGENQDLQKDAQLTASVTCALAGNTMYYNVGNVNGTNVTPISQ